MPQLLSWGGLLGTLLDPSILRQQMVVAQKMLTGPSKISWLLNVGNELKQTSKQKQQTHQPKPLQVEPSISESPGSRDHPFPDGATEPVEQKLILVCRLQQSWDVQIWVNLEMLSECQCREGFVATLKWHSSAWLSSWGMELPLLYLWISLFQILSGPVKSRIFKLQ